MDLSMDEIGRVHVKVRLPPENEGGKDRIEKAGEEQPAVGIV